MSRQTSADPKAPPHPDDWGKREFHTTGFAAYRLSVPKANLTFDVSRLRREREELIGELTVRMDMAGARTVEGILSSGDFNLSSVQARSTRAKHLAARAVTSNDMDWEGWLSELCMKVITAERTGDPVSLLGDIEPTTDLSEFDLHGWTLPRSQPAILFGDGGSAKSLLGLWVAGEMAMAGRRVMYVDWEADGSEHRGRLEKLYPHGIPPVIYARCERPLVTEIDRLRNVALEHLVTYVVLDSAAFGCYGPPEAAETAIGYFRALRSLGVGALVIAHVTKAEDGDKRPFGSSFWHNSARSTWHIKRSNPDDDGPEVQVLLSQRKCNAGRLRSPMAFSIVFSHDAIKIGRSSATDVPEFAASLTLTQRIRGALLAKPQTMNSLHATFAGEKADTIDRTIRRAVDKGVLVRFQNAEGKELIGVKQA